MAKWMVTPGTKGNTMSGKVDYGRIGDKTHWEIKQDISEIKKEIERDKMLSSTGLHNKMGFRKMATIPDIVAIEMKEKHNLDIHSPTFHADESNKKRLRYLLRTEYPDLIINT